MRIKIEMPRTQQIKYSQWVKQLARTNTYECRSLVEGTLRAIERRARLTARMITDKGIMVGKIYRALSANGLNGAVGCDVNYAAYKEWGTGIYVSVPSFVKEDFGVDSMQWKGRGIRQVNSLPVPFLFENARIGYEEMELKLRKMGFK